MTDPMASQVPISLFRLLGVFLTLGVARCLHVCLNSMRESSPVVCLAIVCLASDSPSICLSIGSGVCLHICQCACVDLTMSLSIHT